MEYSFLDNMSKREMEDLRTETLNDICKKRTLVEAIGKKIEANFILNFSSDRIPYYKQENEAVCKKILEEIQFDEMYFFTRSFVDVGNKGGRIDILSTCTKNPFTDLAEIYGIRPYNLDRLIHGIRTDRSFLNMMSDQVQKNLNVPLGKMEEFFQEDEYIYMYENVFNNFNYIKNFIYKLLLENPNLTKEDVFTDIIKKQCFIRDNIGEIASYLYNIRGDVELKMSVSNGGLKRSASKIGTQITFAQQRMIEAVAFGTTMDKLEAHNYEDAKRLIYLPRKK